MWTLPNLLSGVRFILVPILLWLAWTGRSKPFVFCFGLSLVTDAADGFIARQFHQSSRLGSKLDSWADFFTTSALPFCAWWLRPDVIREEAWILGAGVGCYLLTIVIGFLKFSRLTSYHTWGAKVSAVLLAIAAVALFAGGPGWLFRIVMPVIIVAQLEEIAITLLLRRPLQDVPSLFHALKKRREWERVETAKLSQTAEKAVTKTGSNA